MMSDTPKTMVLFDREQIETDAEAIVGDWPDNSANVDRSWGGR